MVVQNERGRKERQESRHRIAQFAVNRPQMCERSQSESSRASSVLKGATTEAMWFLEDDPQSARRVAIRADISHRLRRICPHYSEEEFSDLVDVMTQRQLDGERRANRIADK